MSVQTFGNMPSAVAPSNPCRYCGGDVPRTTRRPRIACSPECYRALDAARRRTGPAFFAQRLNMTVSELVKRRERGERWCSFHRTLHPSTTPFCGATATVCKASWQSYRQALQARRQAS